MVQEVQVLKATMVDYDDQIKMDEDEAELEQLVQMPNRYHRGILLVMEELVRQILFQAHQ